MKLDGNTAYIVSFNGSMDLAYGANYEESEEIVSFECGQRIRILDVVKILKNDDNEFTFEDVHGTTVSFHPITIEDYKKYRSELFYNAPTLTTTEGIQGYLMLEVRR